MRATVLFRDSHVTLARYDHPPGLPHRDPKREESECFAISFVERGSFEVHHAGKSWVLSRGALFVTRPGFPYRCTHPGEAPDDVCLSIHCSPDLVEEAESERGRPWSDLIPVAPLTNRLAYIRAGILAAAGDGVAALAVPPLASEALAAALDPSAPARLHGASQIAWYAARIDAARHLMERRPAEPLSLDHLAREAGMSPFHFSRVFRDLVGVPPHRYLIRLRLARAAEALLGGASVTAAARDAGFPNLGNFIRRFRRAYAVTPSRYRPAMRSNPRSTRAPASSGS